MALGPSPFSLNGTCFRLRMMSVASSTTPGIDWNSCSTPSILTAVTAAPSMDESSTRRRLWPIVVPSPRSKGCAQKRPYLSVNDSLSVARRLGFWNPLQSISSSPFGQVAQRGNPTGPISDCGREGCSGAKTGQNLLPGDWLSSQSQPSQLLLAVQLDDELLVDRQLNIF